MTDDIKLDWTSMNFEMAVSIGLMDAMKSSFMADDKLWTISEYRDLIADCKEMLEHRPVESYQRFVHGHEQVLQELENSHGAQET